MKRTLLVLAVALIAGSCLWAQDLSDNPYYQKSVELKAQAQAAFDQGRYDASAKLAAEAVDNAKLSDQYVAKMVAKAEADRAIAAAKAKLAWADSIDATANFPTEYAHATAEMAAANTAYGAEDYSTARDHALAVVDALAQVKAVQTPVAEATLPLPAAYTVRLLPQRRDCLWRIAEYPFVYDDPLKWPVLYDANKKSFRDPGNPNLIFPGQVLQIPSIAGETRQGSFDPSRNYPTFRAK
jgi:nucleoid-associated protein YgaU